METRDDPPSVRRVQEVIGKPAAMTCVVWDEAEGEERACAVAEQRQDEVTINGWCVEIVTPASPLGKALLGGVLGEVVTVPAPAKAFTLQIVSVDGCPVLDREEREQARQRVLKAAETQRRAVAAALLVRKREENHRLAQTETVHRLREQRQETERERCERERAGWEQWRAGR